MNCLFFIGCTYALALLTLKNESACCWWKEMIQLQNCCTVNAASNVFIALKAEANNP